MTDIKTGKEQTDMSERTLRRRKAQRGFSLIELLVALVILGVLSTIVAVNVLPAGDTARIQAAQTQIGVMSNALRQYRLDLGTYPSEAEGLDLLRGDAAPRLTQHRCINTDRREHRRGVHTKACQVARYDSEIAGEDGLFGH